jgi:hypothetical protein
MEAARLIVQPEAVYSGHLWNYCISPVPPLVDSPVLVPVGSFLMYVSLVK